MKELSIEQKAKRYDEALKVAEKYHNGTLKDVMETIFPELKESEGERIRKSLIDMLKNDEKHYLKEIEWLEKQGESFTKKDVDDAYLKGVCDAKKELERQGEQKSAEWSEEDSPYFDDICELLINILYSESQNYNMKVIKKDLEWFKSLKDRVQPQSPL